VERERGAKGVVRPGGALKEEGWEDGKKNKAKPEGDGELRKRKFAKKEGN